MRKWQLELRDKTIIEIPPHLVASVRKRMTAKEPLNLKSRVVPFSQIEKFYETEEEDTRLLAEASQAFDEPVITEDGAMTYMWVKKTVPSERWNTHYLKIPAYRLLEQLGGSTVMAFRLPMHQLTNNVTPCTEYEVEKLELD